MEKKVPFIYMPLGEFPRGASYYQHIYKYLGPQDLVLFSSRADRAIHDAFVASTPARIAVLPFGIREAHFRASAKERATTRRHLGIKRGEIIFVYHGRVTAEKNVHGVITMFRRIARQYPGTRLWIVGHVDGAFVAGQGPWGISQFPASRLARAFQELLCAESLEDRVEFWGGLPREALRQVLGAADIAVNFTLNRDENFGYGVVEAMAAGLPVLGTDWGGFKDTIEDGVTGFLVPTLLTPIGIAIDHWHAWQRARELVEDAGRRKQMAAVARERVAGVFTLDRFASALAALVRAQVSEAPSNAPAQQHAWSSLGNRLTKNDTFGTLEESRILRDVLRHYATGKQGDVVHPDAVFFLPTDLVSVGRTTVHFRDPIYKAAIQPPDEIGVALVRFLQKHAFCDYESLIKEVAMRFGRASIRSSLRRLLSAGVVLQSRTGGHCQSETGCAATGEARLPRGRGGQGSSTL